MVPVDRPDKSLDRQSVPTIKDLVRHAIDGGKTVRALQADSGDRVRFQAFQELATTAPKGFPKETKTIEGIALALDISEMAVVLAYAQSLGIAVDTDSSFALRLPPGVDGIDGEIQDAIINLTRVVAGRVADNSKSGLTGLTRLERAAKKVRVKKAEHGDHERA
jgi:hypothetical protein